MPTFLLTWNPEEWLWANLAEVSRQTAQGNPFADKRSTGNRKNILPGDRFFLLKQGKQPTGIIASGRFTSKVFEDRHFNEQRAAQGDTALFAKIEFERVLNPADTLPLSVKDVQEGGLSRVCYRVQAPGKKMPQDAVKALEDLWSKYLDEIDGTTYLDADDASDAEQDEEEEFVPEDGDRRASAFRQIKARRGQRSFRDALRKRYGERCMISDCSLMDVIEAAHINPYRDDGDNHPSNGLLLRADLHTLFDLDLLGIEPGTLVVRVHPSANAAGYKAFDGLRLNCKSQKPSNKALAVRWESFCRRAARRMN